MKIAIVKLSALGDIIHAMVVLQFIKQHLPDVTIDWVVEEGFKDILVNNPDIHQIHTVNLKRAKQQKSLRLLFKELKKIRQFGKYDLVIDMQNLVKSALVSRIIPSSKTIGLDQQSSREGFAARFYTDTYAIKHSENVIKRNIAIVSKALNITISSDDILNKQPFLHSNSQMSSDLISSTKMNVALIPGASFESKIYPAKQYAQAIQELDANFVILWGGESEKLIAEKIQQIAPQVRIANRLTLDELKAVISQMNLVIGGDTGPTHMAWALNVPSITLFGSTPGYRNTYLTNINKIIESNSEVNPYKINKNDFSIKSIEVSDIVKVSKELLEGNQ
jgi:heptosyltransferase-1